MSPSAAERTTGGDPSARAQFGEDLLLAEHFGHREQGTYVEVGAHDGVRNSNTYLFEQRGWSGVLVEPDPPEDSLRFLGEVRSSACGPFKTVLGPGSPDHSEHLHFDLAPRRHGGTVCE